MVDLEHALEVARDAARRGGQKALAMQGPALKVDIKDDRSPVTAADKAAEEIILQALAEAFPDHNLLSEETGARSQGSEYCWVVDPIDGTRGFSRGGPFWGPLVALMRGADVVVGVMDLPASEVQYFAASGKGAYKNENRIEVSSVSDWADATLSLGEPKFLYAPPTTDAVVELTQTAASMRCYGDLGAAAMVLDGKAEVFLEAGVKIWDLAPYPVIVKEAGGAYASFSGAQDLESGTAVMSNGKIHEHVMRTLQTKR